MDREALLERLRTDVHRTATVRWYADRVLFENPGDSFVDVPQMLDGGASNLRNPLLARLFRRAGFAEQAGSGIPSIVRTWKGAARIPPTIANNPGSKWFRLTLDWRVLALPRDEQWQRRLGVKISPDAVRILTAGRRAQRLDLTTGRLATGASVRTVTTLLADLVSQKLLVPLEQAEAGPTYKLADHVAAVWDRIAGSPEPEPEPVTAPVSEPVDRAPDSGQRAAQLLALLCERPGLRAPAVRAVLGWSPATVKRTLAHLRAEGSIEYVGPSKTGGYRAVAKPSRPKKRKPKDA